MFSIPNLLTSGNLLSGILSIIFSFSGRIEMAVLFIIIGCLFDFMDGFLARLLKKQSPLGVQLDSLADMVTFGVAPGILMFIMLIISGGLTSFKLSGSDLNDFWVEGTFGMNIAQWITIYFNDLVVNTNSNGQVFKGINLFYPFLGFLIPFMSMFRLAKFNLDERQTNHFLGLPTPANAIFFSSFAIVLWDGFDANDWRLNLSLNLISFQVIIFCIILFSLLLISEIKLLSLKFKNFSIRDNLVRYILIIIAVVLTIALKYWSIAPIILSYIFLSIITNLITKKLFND